MSESDWQYLTMIVVIVAIAAVGITHCICDARARIAAARYGNEEEEE